MSFTETWLKPEIYSSEVFCNQYQVFRRDRLFKKGGGVLIAVHVSLPVEQFDFHQPIDVEFLCVCIRLFSKNIIITCSYIPPSSDISTYLSHMRLIEEISDKLQPTDILIVLGDFNISNISWSFDNDLGYLLPTLYADKFDEFFDKLYHSGLMQFNKVCNSHNHVLDLVFSNSFEISVVRGEPFVNPEDSFHPTVAISLQFPQYLQYRLTLSNKRLNFHKVDYTLLNTKLSSIVWQLDNADLDNCVTSFYDMLSSCLKATIPYVVEKSASPAPPWFTRELKRARNERNRCFKKFKISGLLTDFARYSYLKQQFLTLNNKCYLDYLHTMRLNLQRNPKSFYKFINSKRKTSAFPSQMSNESTVSSDPQVIANMFANYFEQSYTTISPDLNAYPYTINSYHIFNNIVLSENEVLDKLNTIKYSCLPGPDGVPSCILLMCAPLLVKPLLHIFNLSLRSGIFPSLWKASYILPFYKNGSRSYIKNYRGIAKLSAIPKLFEQLVTHRLIRTISSIVSPQQHGFISGKSTVTNLLEFTCHITNSFSKGLQTDVVFTDLSKAFDKVNHSLLIYKLEKIGFPINLVKWLASYLHDRTQRVLFNSVCSQEIYVCSGVPQGSHIGPLLFVLFINDLPSVINNASILMYADDVKIFYSSNNIADFDLLKSDLVALTNWCEINCMSLNVDKCKHMSFSRFPIAPSTYQINGINLESVESFNDLGVILDAKLRFHLHIHSVINKSRHALGFIKRWSKEFSDPYVTKSLYISLVRPILEYASIVWSPSYSCDINSLESVQKQFLLFALRGLGWDPIRRLPPYEHRLQLIDLPSLERRRLVLGITFMINLINGKIVAPFILNQIDFNVPSRISRNYVPIRLPQCRTNFEAFSPLRLLCKAFNDYYQLFNISDSLSSIKKKLYRA